MKTIKFIAIILFSLGFSTLVVAQNPQVSANADAGATIITPLSIENLESLEFGNIIVTGTAGTVTIATNGTPTYTGVNAPVGLTNETHAAQFKVTGHGTSQYTIDIAQVTALTSGGNTMNLSNFTNNASKKLTDGTETFNVGATLAVAADQPNGRYEGSFKVTVAYE